MFGPNGSDFSLSGFDLERYLQVSPALLPSHQDTPSSENVRTRSIGMNFSEPTEAPAYSVAVSQMDSTRPAVDSSVGSAAPTQVVPPISGDQHPNAKTASSEKRKTPTGISFSEIRQQK
jgi:hypothetical protein